MEASESRMFHSVLILRHFLIIICTRYEDEHLLYNMKSFEEQKLLHLYIRIRSFFYSEYHFTSLKRKCVNNFKFIFSNNKT